MPSIPSTLLQHPYGPAVKRILDAALKAADPGEAVRRFARRDGDRLVIDGRDYALFTSNGQARPVRVFALGKAAYAMSLALAEILAGLSPAGLMVTKHLPPASLAGFKVLTGEHPVPGAGSLQAGKEALRFAEELPPGGLLICLISGGGSALACAPYPPLSLEDLQAVTSALLRSGARIDEINTLRRHLDQVKGGRLAQRAAPGEVVSLILSDVVNSPLEAIASGPTAPDPSTRADALALLQKYNLSGELVPGVRAALEAAPETPKPGANLFARVQNVIVGSVRLAAEAALLQAGREGFSTRLLSSSLQGEARQVALELCHELKGFDSERQPLPLCWVAGGETTVTLHGTGQGGRNQELALASVPALAEIPHAMLISLATDGEDGPAPSSGETAAGALVTSDSLNRARSMGLDPADYLARNDSYPFFTRLGDLVITGPTGTNVNDLVFLFRFNA